MFSSVDRVECINAFLEFADVAESQFVETVCERLATRADGSASLRLPLTEQPIVGEDEGGDDDEGAVDASDRRRLSAILDRLAANSVTRGALLYGLIKREPRDPFCVIAVERSIEQLVAAALRSSQTATAAAAALERALSMIAGEACALAACSFRMFQLFVAVSTASLMLRVLDSAVGGGRGRGGGATAAHILDAVKNYRADMLPLIHSESQWLFCVSHMLQVRRELLSAAEAAFVSSTQTAAGAQQRCGVPILSPPSLQLAMLLRRIFVAANAATAGALSQALCVIDDMLRWLLLKVLPPAAAAVSPLPARAVYWELCRVVEAASIADSSDDTTVAGATLAVELLTTLTAPGAPPAVAASLSSSSTTTGRAFFLAFDPAAFAVLLPERERVFADAISQLYSLVIDVPAAAADAAAAVTAALSRDGAHLLRVLAHALVLRQGRLGERRDAAADSLVGDQLRALLVRLSDVDASDSTVLARLLHVAAVCEHLGVEPLQRGSSGFVAPPMVLSVARLSRLVELARQGVDALLEEPGASLFDVPSAPLIVLAVARHLAAHFAVIRQQWLADTEEEAAGRGGSKMWRRHISFGSDEDAVTLANALAIFSTLLTAPVVRAATLSGAAPQARREHRPRLEAQRPFFDLDGSHMNEDESGDQMNLPASPSAAGGDGAHQASPAVAATIRQTAALFNDMVCVVAHILADVVPPLTRDDDDLEAQDIVRLHVVVAKWFAELLVFAPAPERLAEAPTRQAFAAFRAALAPRILAVLIGDAWPRVSGFFLCRLALRSLVSAVERAMRPGTARGLFAERWERLQKIA